MSDERRVAERRTLALRGPGAGGFTPAQSVAASNPCLNCGTNIQLDYCPECGQKEIDPDPTLREFLQELAETMLRWDGRLLGTMRLLFTAPGELTNEYLAGRRVRFISPLRLYLACGVLYFFCAAFFPAGRLSRAVTAVIAPATVVLLPLFAFLFAFFFRDRRRRYPQHLAFAMHVHAMLFVALTVMLLGRLTSVTGVRLALELIVGAGMAVYTVLAARRVYGGAQAAVLMRVVGVFVGYAAVFAAVLYATLAIAA